MNKRIFPILTLIILGLSLIAIIPSLSQESEDTWITGFLPPKIDGLLAHKGANYLQSQFIHEWEDGKFTVETFVSPQDEKFYLDTYVKSVSDNLFVAIESLDANFIDEVEDAIIQIDLDNSQDLSDGDFRLIYDNFDEMGYQVLNSGEWVDLTNFSNNIQLAFLASIGSMAGNKLYTNTITYFSLEIQFNIPRALQYLEIAGIPVEAENNNNKIGYGIQFRNNIGLYTNNQNQDETTVGQDYGLSNYEQDSFDINIPDIISTDVGIDHIEVTQAIQYENNTLPLIQGKQTLARVFINHAESFDLPVLVRLYAYNSIGKYFSLGMMSKVYLAPEDPNRLRYNDSANFKLPAYWEDRNGLLLRAEVFPIGKIDTNSENNDQWFAKELLDTHDFVMYNIRLNHGNYTHVNQTSIENYNAFQMWFEHSYPTNPHFVDFGWEMMGPFEERPTNLLQNYYYLIKDLNNWYYELMATRTLALIFGIPSDSLIPLPDQIFATTIYDVGLSNPAWHSYENGFPTTSRVTHGGAGSPVEGLVMAHEVNHNILNNESGRHAPGCGAGGRDPTWEENTGTPFSVISENGWSPANDTIIRNRNDFMSYCGIFSEPVVWISPYRWVELTNRFLRWTPGDPVDPELFPSESTLNLNSESRLDQLSNSKIRIISGMISSTDAPSIDPSFVIPGYVNQQYENYNPAKHSHYLEIFYNNATSRTIGIGPFNFDHIEGGTTDIVPFTIPILDNDEIVKIEINDPNGQVTLEDSLAFISLSSQDFSYPTSIKRGEQISISWPANYQNTTNIYAQLRYTPDGSNWFKIGKPTTDNSFELKIDTLPGGGQGNFEVLFSDGFATSSILLNGAQIEHSPPTIYFEDTELYIETENGISKVNNELETEIGSLFSIEVNAQDEMGNLINTIEWEIPELDLLFESSTNFDFRFSSPGEYHLSATVVGPRSQLQTSIELLVKVSIGFLAEIDEINNFNHILEENRSQQSSISQTTPDANEEDDGFFNNLLNFSSFWLIPMSMIVIYRLRQLSNSSKQK